MSTTDFLCGVWKTDRNPIDMPPQDGDVVISFNADQTATHAAFFADHREVTHLTFSADSDAITFSQPTKSETIIKYRHLSDGSLELWFGGAPGRFLKYITLQH